MEATGKVLWFTVHGIAPFYSGSRYAKIRNWVSDLFDDKDSIMERIDRNRMKNVLYTQLYRHIRSPWTGKRSIRS